jgi:hypothetical protein
MQVEWETVHDSFENEEGQKGRRKAAGRGRIE